MLALSQAGEILAGVGLLMCVGGIAVGLWADYARSDDGMFYAGILFWGSWVPVILMVIVR